MEQAWQVLRREAAGLWDAALAGASWCSPAAPAAAQLRRSRSPRSCRRRRPTSAARQRPHPVHGVPPRPGTRSWRPTGSPRSTTTAGRPTSTGGAGRWATSPSRSPAYLNRDCGSITFDHQGRVMSVCVGAPGPSSTCSTPPRWRRWRRSRSRRASTRRRNLFQDFTGGGYFYLDNQDRVVTATTTHHIYVIAETPGAPGFTLVRDYRPQPGAHRRARTSARRCRTRTGCSGS